MLRFYAKDYLELDRLFAFLDRLGKDGDLKESTVQNIRTVCDELMERLTALGQFNASLAALRRMRADLDARGVVDEEVRARVRDIQSRTLDEFDGIMFFHMSAEEGAWWEWRDDEVRKALGGRFERVQDDFMAAAKCLATSNDTAAVFHLMRA